MKTKKSKKLTLRDRLSRLTYVSTCQLLGETGKELLKHGAEYDNIDVDRDVYLGDDLFRLKLNDYDPPQQPIVTITLMTSERNRLRWNCTVCDETCKHVGAAFSLILDDKYTLGLSDAPIMDIPLEHLGEEQLVERAIAERAQRAKEEKYRLKSADPKQAWTDYVLTSATSGKSYRLALRGAERGESYCSCPDFRTNTLGTCKHLIYALERVRSKFSGKRLRSPKRKSFEVYVRYEGEIALQLAAPDQLDPEAEQIAKQFLDCDIDDAQKLVRCIGKLEQNGFPVTVYPDAEELIQQRLFAARIKSLSDEIRRDPARHPLRTSLLKAELLPYQMDGIAFAVGAGRAVLADDMGLGKTIQGVGVAELLAQEAGIRKVLVICPTSLKSQWRNEVHRFSNRDVQLVIGSAEERASQYDNDCFFTVCNYEQVLRDLLSIERVKWDLIILDEGQRIKNWEAKTSNIVKSLKSPFALVLSGTPLENRLDELFSVVQFIDDRRLAPAFRFFNRHRVVDENGKVIGYKNLDELRANLKPILLRRTRDGVLDQLPPRTTEIIRIPPTGEQYDIHQGNMRKVTMITNKPFLTEMDLLQLRTALLMCRMSANSTFLVDKQEPSYSSKLSRLDELVEQLFAEENRKAVLFSEWTTMLGLIEPILQKHGLDYVRLDGSVPQKKRQQLVHRFQNERDCKLFITTNAGSTGLNLQAANTIINVDLPWNPAILEQRIARAHRMGQKRPVQVFLLVTENTLEENLLATLSNKQELALAALDAESDVSQVDFISHMEEMKRRLEVLIGAKPEAPLDITSQQQAEHELDRFNQHRERVAAAGGEMLGAVFNFLGELVAQDTTSAPPAPEVVSNLRQNLADCVEEDEQGQQRLTITLPNRDVLNNLAETLAKLLAAGEK
ncbi:MAG: DEAD/DEAH box helicase [Planctomycetaceae bacterium]|nr:DEAD/DEAH box helicase [Planctomycetales bacterium]MCB9926629.1 DEAD/DEAH box helicase [Planctomycetaceae bacterium]